MTGAARGIGRRVAEVLGAEGYRLVLVDLCEPADGPEAEWVVLDVSSEAAVAAAAQRIGPIDVLVNNAGISFIERAEDTTAEQWRRVLEVNLTGPFLLCRAFGPSMLERGDGAIVNIASVAGLLGVAQRAAYNASKHGLIGLTRTLAAEWGWRGVRVNAVCPGWVKTEMDVEDQAAGGGYTDADIEGHVPMGRFATPDDVAAAVAFLADPAKSGFVNGAALSVDGGWAADGSWLSLKNTARS